MENFLKSLSPLLISLGSLAFSSMILLTSSATGETDAHVYAAGGSIPAAITSPRSGTCSRKEVDPVLYGAYDNAIGSSVTVGNTRPPAVMGGAENGAGTGGINGYPTLDTVARFTQATAPPPIISVSGTFDKTHFFPAQPIAANSLAMLRSGSNGTDVGMWLMTNHRPKAYVGQLKALSPNALTVQGWFQLGTKSGFLTPPGTAIVHVNAVTKVWTDNSVIRFEEDSLAREGTGYELDIVNQSGSRQTRAVGVDVVQFGNAAIDGSAFKARGDFLQYGFHSLTGRLAGFMYDPAQQAYVNPTLAGYASRQRGGRFLAVQPADSPVATFEVDAVSGSITTKGTLRLTNYMLQPADGSTIAVPANTPWLHLTAGVGNMHRQAVILPPNPADGQVIQISTEVPFTGAWEVQAANPDSVAGTRPPAPQGSIEFRYIASSHHWIEM